MLYHYATHANVSDERLTKCAEQLSLPITYLILIKAQNHNLDIYVLQGFSGGACG